MLLRIIRIIRVMAALGFMCALIVLVFTDTSNTKVHQQALWCVVFSLTTVGATQFLIWFTSEDKPDEYERWHQYAQNIHIDKI